jgi:hypothetical protein
LHDRVASAGGVARREGFYLLYILAKVPVRCTGKNTS